MNFQVKRYAGLKEVIFEEGNFVYTTGFMTQEECRRMAADFISAAENLLYGDMSVIEFIEESQ